MNYKEFMSPENTQVIRDRLVSVMYKNDFSMAKMAKDIGISSVTICKFIREDGEVNFLTLMKIEDFVVTHEKETA